MKNEQANCFRWKPIDKSSSQPICASGVLGKPKYRTEEQSPTDKTNGTTQKVKTGNLGLKVAHWYFCVVLRQFVFWLLSSFICCLCASLSSCHFLQKCSEFSLLSDSECVYRKQSLPKYKVVYKSKTFLTSSVSKEVATHLTF